MVWDKDIRSESNYRRDPSTESWDTSVLRGWEESKNQRTKQEGILIKLVKRTTQQLWCPGIQVKNELPEVESNQLCQIVQIGYIL